MLKQSLCSLSLLVSMFAVPTLAAVFRVYVHQDAVQLGYALSVAERQRDSLHGQLQRLHVDLAARRSPGHLAQMARSFGLRPPSVTQTLSGHSAPAHLARADLKPSTRQSGIGHAIR